MSREEPGTIVSIAHGDFREMYERIKAGGPETYHGQRNSAEHMRSLADRGYPIYRVCLRVEPFEDTIEGGIRVHGIREGSYSKNLMDVLRPILERVKPTYLIGPPRSKLLDWANRKRVRTLPITAASWDHIRFRKSPRLWWEMKRMVSLLNRPEIEWVGNHNVSASRSLVRAGVDANKVIPYDVAGEESPVGQEPKAHPQGRPLCFVFAGRISELKGVGDCLRAAASVKADGRDVRFVFLGEGDVGAFENQARSLGIDDRVEFRGRVPKDDVLQLMIQSDAVVVPSRPGCPEGMPFVIKEAFSAKAPVVASDHPMFGAALRHEKTALVFRAGDDKELARCISRLVADRDLFERLSRAGEEGWQSMQCPVMARDLVDRWLADAVDDREWLSKYSIGSGYYDER